MPDYVTNTATWISIFIKLPAFHIDVGTYQKLAHAMTQKRSVYFGYGSNMWLDQMDRRCPENKYLGIGFIQDWYVVQSVILLRDEKFVYRKWFICERGFANIRRSPGDQVYGLAYELSESDERILDGYEGVPHHYVKEYHTINFLDSAGKSEIKALIYINEELLEEGTPKAEYVYRMNMAIKDGTVAGTPEEYMNKYLRPFIPEISDEK